jgi:hypothetical protein
VFYKIEIDDLGVGQKSRPGAVHVLEKTLTYGVLKKCANRARDSRKFSGGGGGTGGSAFGCDGGCDGCGGESAGCGDENDDESDENDDESDENDDESDENADEFGGESDGEIGNGGMP